MELLEIDEVQAQAILDMQLRRLAALERQKIIDDHDELEAHDRRLHRHPRQAGAPARHRLRGARRDRREVRRRPPHRRSCRSTATCRWRTSSPRRTSSSRSPAAATPSAPGSTPTARSGAAARACEGASAARRRHRRPLLHDHHAPLAAVLHQPGPGLPRQGLRAAGCRPRRQGPARRQPDGLPAGRADRPGAGRARLRAAPPYLVLATQGAAWSRRPGSASTTAPRSGGLIAVNLRDGDELVGAGLAESERRPAAGLAQGPVGALPRRRRHAAPDGPRRPPASRA